MGLSVEGLQQHGPPVIGQCPVDECHNIVDLFLVVSGRSFSEWDQYPFLRGAKHGVPER